jgi:hypothetical protein
MNPASPSSRRLLIAACLVMEICLLYLTLALAQARRPAQEQSGIPESSYKPGNTANGERETDATPPPGGVIHSTAALDGSGAYGNSTDKSNVYP